MGVGRGEAAVAYRRRPWLPAAAGERVSGTGAWELRPETKRLEYERCSMPSIWLRMQEARAGRPRGTMGGMTGNQPLPQPLACLWLRKRALTCIHLLSVSPSSLGTGMFITRYQD